ncbi:hypothetical protein TNCV_3965151 [Trichonephila clavipes]|nr:hypothetical protein TNCV_3965151 [Trichonephila clavipes]
MAPCEHEGVCLHNASDSTEGGSSLLLPPEPTSGQKRCGHEILIMPTRGHSKPRQIERTSIPVRPRARYYDHSVIVKEFYDTPN